MSDNKKQLARIRLMERHLNRATAAVKRLEAAFDKWEDAQEAIAALEEYYGSDLWKQDLADDEAGRLPADLKRGVLSEDGIWNLLTDVHDLTTRLKKGE
jgi:flagellar biosynthesis regulator FlaF